MEKKFAASFCNLLRDISEATSRREESESDYQDLLRKIFEEGGAHDHTNDDPVVQSQVDVEKLATLEAFGREREMGNLLRKCFNPEKERIQLSAIPIVGAAGIGKTTLARRVYDNELVPKHFEVRAWVNVGGQELRLRHTAEQILKSTTGMAFSSLDDPDEMVRDTLQGRKCLIVFDGVESMTDDLWLHMNTYWFSFVDLGSIVLITTRIANLVSSEAFELKQVFPFQVRPLYRHLSIDAMVIVKGIPLLLTLVVSMMGCNDKLRKLLSQGEFSDVVFPSTFDASAVILLSIWALPPQLRQCLAFCALFPKDYALHREKIITMWVAHGLVKPASLDEKNLQDIGDSYFHQLLRRSFFADIGRNEYGDISDFRMPGLVHTVMQDVAGVVLIGKLGVIGSISEEAARLSLHSKFAQDTRFLILSSTLYSDIGSSLDHSLFDFKELQSLDLSCSGIRSLSDGICALTDLRYLNLSYTLLETLPDSIAGLSRLQTLDLSWCYHFKVLPKAIRDLSRMSHLDLSQCESLSHLPAGVGLLISLTSMPLFVLGEDLDSACLGELGQLNQLRGRLDIRNLENVTEVSEARDAKLNQKRLQHLGLYWSKDADPDCCFQVIEFLAPNEELKVVDITGYMGFRFPRWISSMTSLVKVSITDSGCKVLPSLGDLPLLKELQLKGMANIKYIGRGFYGVGSSDAFPSLEQLGLYEMPKLFEWSGAGGDFASPMFCSLKTLTIEGCPRLQNIPTFGSLEDLIICSCSVEILSHSNRTRFGSPSSLLIKNMEFGNFLEETRRWRSLKKLILFNSAFYANDLCLEMLEFTDIEHLGIAHCPQVKLIKFRFQSSIQKLHFVDCPNLERIYLNQEASKLTELVVDGCPELHHPSTMHGLRSVTKLIIRRSGGFIRAGSLIMLKKLQYLSISQCPWLEKELELEPSLISHIPCVIMRNHNDSEEDTMSTLFDSEYDSRQESTTFKGSSSPGSTILQWAPKRSLNHALPVQ